MKTIVAVFLLALVCGAMAQSIDRCFNDFRACRVCLSQNKASKTDIRDCEVANAGLPTCARAQRCYMHPNCGVECS